MTSGTVDFASDAVRAALQRDLLAWFGATARDLPWRRQRSLYGTWISEMMLQQTTVATVVPYWERFMARFPDVEALAAAPEDVVLAHWSGLGYYRRARQLHAAAREVVAELGGILPDQVDGWRELPGIGPYAAGAIASIGLGLPVPAVDANVRRVLGRWLGGGPLPGTASSTAVESLAGALVPPDRPGPWNEALMELGALVCSPRSPACDICPVAAHCGARRAGAVADPSPAAVRAAATPVDVLLVAFVAGTRVWLEVPGGRLLRCESPVPPAREAFGKLHQGLLTLPTTAWYRRAPAGTPGLLGALAAGWDKDAGFPGGAEPREVGRFSHAITRYRLTVAVAVVDLPEDAPVPGDRAGCWAGLAEAPGLNISQLARKALRLITHGRG